MPWVLRCADGRLLPVDEVRVLGRKDVASTYSPTAAAVSREHAEVRDVAGLLVVTTLSQSKVTRVFCAARGSWQPPIPRPLVTGVMSLHLHEACCQALGDLPPCKGASFHHKHLHGDKWC